MTSHRPKNKLPIDHLIQEAGKLPTNANRKAVLRALATMPRWFVIDLGSRDGVLPLVGEDGQDPSVLLFTSGEQAADMLRLHGELPDSARVMSLSTHEVSEFLTGLRQWGVRSAVFNPGPLGVEFDLDDLIVAAWLHRPESLPDIDSLAAQASQVQPNREADSLWQAVVSLPCWYMVSDPAIQADPMVGICRDQPCALVFTDPVRARQHSELMDPSSRRTGNRLIALPPHQALWWFRSLATRGIAGAIFNDGPFAFFIPMGRMMAPVDAVRSVA